MEESIANPSAALMLRLGLPILFLWLGQRVRS